MVSDFLSFMSHKARELSKSILCLLIIDFWPSYRRSSYEAEAFLNLLMDAEDQPVLTNK